MGNKYSLHLEHYEKYFNFLTPIGNSFKNLCGSERACTLSKNKLAIFVWAISVSSEGCMWDLVVDVRVWVVASPARDNVATGWEVTVLVQAATTNVWDVVPCMWVLK